MAHGYGYWVRNKRIVDVTNSVHITYLNHNPTLFGLTQKKIEQIHKKYNERIGIEGNARNELIKLGCRSGWIRVRHYVGEGDYWSIQFDDWKKRKKTAIGFVRKAVRNNIVSKYDELILTGFDDGFYKEYTYATGGAETFLKELRYQWSTERRRDFGQLGEAEKKTVKEREEIYVSTRFCR